MRLANWYGPAGTQDVQGLHVWNAINVTAGQSLALCVFQWALQSIQTGVCVCVCVCLRVRVCLSRSVLTVHRHIAVLVLNDVQNPART